MKVKLLQPVMHDGELYESGDTLELSNDAAKALIDTQAAERADLATQAKTAKTSKKEST